MQSGASGIIEVSRTRALRNTCIFEGERGTFEVGFWDRLGLVKLNVANQPITLTAAEAEAGELWRDVFRRQFTDFAVAVRDGRKPFVPGREGRRSIQLIDDCYASRQPLSQPWTYPIAKTGTN
jgi:predicted dehydrogenase